MKIFLNVARLEIGHLFSQGARRWHPCTLDTFLVLLAFSQVHCYNIRPEFTHVNKDDALMTNIL